MRIKFFFGLVAVFFGLNPIAQSKMTLNQAALAKSVIAQGNLMGASFLSSNYNNYLRYVHPIVIELAGGEKGMIQTLIKQKIQVKNMNTEISSISFESPSKIFQSGNELQCIITQHTKLVSKKGSVITYSSFIVLSNDFGKSWRFIDASNKDILLLRKLIPNLSQEIILPPKQSPKVTQL
jgi:hypothetical protein